MVVVAITGLPLSGKSVATEFFIKKGFEQIKLKALVRGLTIEQGIEITNDTYRKFADDLRRMRGMDAVARLALPILKQLEGKKVVFDGIRGMEEIELFRQHRNDIVLLGIWSPFKARFMRAVKRKREDEALNKDDFRKRDHIEIGWGIPVCIALADYLIINDQNEGDFLSKLEDIFQWIT